MIPADFRGAALPRSPTIFRDVAADIGCEEDVVRAVVAVETLGKGFLPDGRPQALFERQWFHRLTGGRWDGAAPDISDPTAGGYVGRAGEYDRIETAYDLDPTAALQATSWGLGQIMGFNYALAGFLDVESYVAAMCRGEDDQMRAFASFIKAAGLADELRDKRWADFARGYNGPAYRRNEYDTRLAAEYAKRLAVTRNPIAPPERATVAELQSLLNVAGFSVAVDGWPGPETTGAVKRFQQAHGLAVDGIAGPKTMAALLATTGGLP
jgi:hypothetical protein